MKKIINSILLMLFLSLGTLCAQFGTTQMENYLLKAYYDLSSESMYGKLHWMLGDCASDLTELGGEIGGYDFPAAQALMYHDLDSYNDVINIYGVRAYTMIYACNMSILAAPGTSLDNTLKARYVAEAKFIRALSYFNLACLFDSVPVLTGEFDWPMLVDHDAVMDYDPSFDHLIKSYCNPIN